jgi:hypothetical protein
MAYSVELILILIEMRHTRGCAIKAELLGSYVQIVWIENPKVLGSAKSQLWLVLGVICKRLIPWYYHH